MNYPTFIWSEHTKIAHDSQKLLIFAKGNGKGALENPPKIWEHFSVWFERQTGVAIQIFKQNFMFVVWSGLVGILLLDLWVNLLILWGNWPVVDDLI